MKNTDTKTVKATNKKQAKVEIIKEQELENQFVFMDKTFQILDIGFATKKNVVLFGSGGHGI